MASFARGVRLGIALFMFFCLISSVCAAQVRLQWDASPSAELIEYRLYRGVETNNYTVIVPLPVTATNTLVTGLSEGALYFFAITAVDEYGIESDFSNEISYRVPRTTPSATAKSYTVLEDQTVAVVLAGTDPNNDPLTFRTKTLPANGTLSGTPPALTYRPNANFAGKDTFTYTASDASSTSAVATVTINVTAVNDAPTLNAIAAITAPFNSGTLTVNLSGITSGATNELQPLTVTAVSSNPTLLTPTVTYAAPASTGSLSFKPALNKSGTTTITVTVNDGQPTNNLITRTFVVTVTVPLSPPVVSNAMEVSNDARTLQIGWTTDQVSICALEYGTNTLYGKSSIASTGTTHHVTLTNLTPATLYFLRVRATNANAIASVTSIGSAATSPINVISIAAETGVTNAQMFVKKDLAALDGAAISNSIVNLGKATFSFTAAEGLNYQLWARVKTPAGGSALYVSADGRPETVSILPQIGTPTGYGWRILSNGINPLVIPLSEGAHQISIRAGATNMLIDELILSNDPIWQPILPTTQPVLTATSATTTSFDLRWDTKAGNAENVVLESSADGLTFSTVSVLPATTTMLRLQNAATPLFFRIYARDSVDRTGYSAVVRGNPGI